MTRPFALAFASLLLVGAAAPPPAAYDIVIRGGRVLDGAGNPWITADVAIKDGRIARVGAIEAKGKQEIDALQQFLTRHGGDAAPALVAHYQADLDALSLPAEAD